MSGIGGEDGAMPSLRRDPANPIMERTAAPHHEWEAGSVLNPCVVRDGDRYRMLYRATNDVHMGQAGRYVSSIGMATSEDGTTWHREPAPLIVPSSPDEAAFGCED